MNYRFFDGALPDCAITVQSSGHRKVSMGWCTTKEVWGDKEGKIKLYEINISAEFLDDDFFETMDTLMHEMVHLYNIVHDVKDCSRNNTYHNKHFKNRAIKSGFFYPDSNPDKRYGWSFAKLSPETKEIIRSLAIDQTVFSISRKGAMFFDSLSSDSKNEVPEVAADPKSYKWVCPSCVVIVRSKKRILI